ncbi:MAG TPA: hypothetical protein VI755_14495 [Anaerolineales bacterium]|nr:hypothetical protein [Anaerolineales bacterium]
MENTTRDAADRRGHKRRAGVRLDQPQNAILYKGSRTLGQAHTRPSASCGAGRFYYHSDSLRL